MKTLDDFNMKSKKPWEVEGVEWRKVRLGDLVIEKPKYGLTTKAKDKGKFVFLRITDIDGQGNIKNNNFKFVDLEELEKEKYEIGKGDLLLARSGSVGNFFIALQDFPDWVYASYLIRFRLDLNKINPLFIKYYLSSQYFKKWVSFQKRPSAQPNINAKEFSSFKIPLPFCNGNPDLETQKKIVEYIEANFSKIDKILEKKKKELEKLDELWENVLEQAFKPKEGEEWREVRLGDIAEHFMGGTPRTTIDEYWDGSIPWISAKELSNNNIYITKPTRYITEKGLKESNARVAPKDSILLVTTASVGNVAIAGIDLAINQQITAIVPKRNVWFKYLYYYLSHNATRLLLRGQTTFKHINQKMVRKLPVLIPFHNNQPDLEKQKEIANYLDSVYEKIKALKEKIQRQINLLEEMKESILDEVFNHGETK